MNILRQLALVADTAVNRSTYGGKPLYEWTFGWTDISTMPYEPQQKGLNTRQKETAK